LNVRDLFKRWSGFRSSLRIDRLTVLRAIWMPENVGRNTQQFLKAHPVTSPKSAVRMAIASKVTYETA
jgi:hypothetical protein